jgi:hypothetical protein
MIADALAANGVDVPLISLSANTFQMHAIIV